MTTENGQTPCSQEAKPSRKLPVMCCTNRIGKGKFDPSPPRSCTRALGPPVDVAIPSMRWPPKEGCWILDVGCRLGATVERLRTTLTWLIIASWVQRRSASASYSAELVP